MEGIRCFMLEPTDPRRERRWLRRYSVQGGEGVCPLHSKGYSYHNAQLLLGDFDDESVEAYAGCDNKAQLQPPHDDPRWPAVCACGAAFQPDDLYQLCTHTLYRRADTGEILTLDDAPPGAMWYATWYHGIPDWCGPDGKALIVRCPGGHTWHCDGLANNCDMPNDKEHKCWVRHGTPPDVTVDKNGKTCNAGAGSILTPNWHGYLRNGYLEKC